jgi:CheY-like chemotaxis protein
VAHELNNPLQSIVGYTDLLIAAERQQSARGDLEEIRFAAHRAAKIVQNLLAFVRRSSTERTTENLNAIVLRTVALRQYELASTGLVLEESYGEDLPPVLVNREEIQQILLNIVLNAEQAMRSAGLHGRLSIRTLRTGTSDVAVEIQDDGPGVPQALAGRIFEPFFTTKNVGEGTGLGLSLAIGIAEAHGGELALIPVSRGACFRLTLPATTMPVVVTPPASQDMSSMPAGNGRRALVVDDEPALRQVLQRLLTQRGFIVDVAEDGHPACGLIEHHGYDVIFCDLQTPNMGGMELLDWIRRCHPASTAAFVLVTGGLLTRELQAVIESSHIAVLAKPFGAAALDTLLEELLAEPQGVTARPR